MHLLENLIVAFSMYSKIPMPHIKWTKQNMRFTLCFFPLIGIAVGIAEILWFLLAEWMELHVILTSAGLVLIPLLISGGIHMDGLLDTADALSSWQPKEKRLEILKDSNSGAFAVITCCGYFLAQFAIFTEANRREICVLAVGFALSRALSGYGVTSEPCAKDSGLVHAFASAADRKKSGRILLLEAAACAAGMIALAPVPGTAGAAGALITFFACRHMALKTFGGTTGDIQGFFLEICELVMAFCVILTGQLFLHG